MNGLNTTFRFKLEKLNKPGKFETPPYIPTNAGRRPIYFDETGVFNPPPMQIDPTMRGSLKLNDIFQGSVGIASQIISAWGRNPTQQVGYPGINAITGGAPQQPTYQQPPQPTPEQIAAMMAARGLNPDGTPLGKAAGQGIDGIFKWISDNPMVALGIGGALYLWMKEPPRKR